MKILLISPCKDPDYKRPKCIMMPQLALHLIAGLTPPEYDVKIIEEEIEDINLDEECDIVGLSCMTSNAPRAYYFAQEFKKRGKKVVIGGVHPTILPDEALQYTDSVIIGEAEGVWEQVLEDFKNGRLQKKYHKPYPSLEKYVHIKHRRDTKKRLFNVVPVMTTRGCPYNCDFCCVTTFFGNTYRFRPLASIIEEIESFGNIQCLFFQDDNIVGDRSQAKEFFHRLIPLNIRWAGGTTLATLQDEELLALMRESGCMSMFVGLESLNRPFAKNSNQLHDRIEYYYKTIERLHAYGIMAYVAFIFGFDEDDISVFEKTVQFAKDACCEGAAFHVLTPYPGTRLYKKLNHEGRICIKDWQYYDGEHAVFHPKRMSLQELEEGFTWAIKEFYSMKSIVQRLWGSRTRPFFAIPWNVFIYFDGHFKQP